MDETINKISDDKVSQQSGRWKNVLKWILRVLWCIILWIAVCFICLVCLSNYDNGVRKAWLISFCITILLILLIVYIARLPQTNKIKKLAKWIVIILWCLVVFCLIWYLLILWIRYLLPRKTILQLIIALWIVVCALLILFTILLIKWYKSKNNKFIKWIILNAVITVVVIRWWLTSAGIIPNWLWIEALYSCVDCNWQYFNTIRGPYQINWINCCAWTFSTMRDLWRCDSPEDPCIN